MTTSRRRGGWGMALAVGIATLILVGLGVWQLQRLHWKQSLLARIDALQHAPPEPLAVVLGRLSDGRDAEYVRVRADCPDIEAGPNLRLHGVRDGVLGYRLISACKAEAGPYRSVLVDRGFIAREDYDRVKPNPEPLQRAITGVLRQGDAANSFTPPNQPADNLWYSRDPTAMAAALHVSAPAPTFLMLEAPPPRAFGPTPAALPPQIANRHLEYALTWFGLALTLLGVYIAKLFSDRRA
ncbi:MAG: SURF1 family cytochrome oxidase biogenesis protein [Caulobacteraceae bacterium]